MNEVSDLPTARDCKGNHRLLVWCKACRVQRELSFKSLVDDGRGVNLPFRCTNCGSRLTDAVCQEAIIHRSAPSYRRNLLRRATPPYAPCHRWHGSASDRRGSNPSSPDAMPRASIGQPHYTARTCACDGYGRHDWRYCGISIIQIILCKWQRLFTADGAKASAKASQCPVSKFGSQVPRV